jgi:hypothetical protein
MIRALMILAGALVCTPGLAQTSVAAEDMRLELVLEERAHPPFAEEMILLKIIGAYRLPITLEKLIQPDLEGFNWMQLGEDIWYRERENGLDTLKFERRMALFPHEAGTFTIGPFAHELSLLSRSGQRFDHRLVSDTVSLTVRAPPDRAAWWFPTRKLEIEDRWSNAPEGLAEGSSALRIVTLTVEGTEPARIPPMPDLTAAGAFVFPQPEQRIVSLGPGGPITRVFWRWTVRPAQTTAGYLNPIDVSYFDTQTQEAKTITLSAQRVAYAGVDGAGPAAFGTALSTPTPSDQNPGEQLKWQIPAIPLPIMLLGGTITGFLLSIPLMRRGQWRLPGWLTDRDPDHTALHRAARHDDAMAVWHHANRLLNRNGQQKPPLLLELGAALFGSSSKPRPDLRAVARACGSASYPNP